MLAVAPVFVDVVPQAAVAITSDATSVFTGTVAAVADQTAIANESLLQNAFTFQLIITTESDILLFEAGFSDTPGVNVPGGWYNNNSINGSDTAPANNPLLIAAVPEIAADAYLTTPSDGTFPVGSNTLAGPPDANLAIHADGDNDGPQTDFQFANVTLIPDADGRATATFGGQVQTSGVPVPNIDDFEFALAIGDFRVTRGAAVGTTVGTVSATDSDGDALTYSITAGNTNNTFSIDAATGEILTSAPVDLLSYELTVEVEDTEGLTDTMQVIVNLSDAPNSGWHNPLNPFDVNASGDTTPLDALIIINELNTNVFSDPTTGVIDSSTPAPPFFDINGDQIVAPIDALLVINELNEVAASVGATSSFVATRSLDSSAAVAGQSQNLTGTFFSLEDEDA